MSNPIETISKHVKHNLRRQVGVKWTCFCFDKEGPTNQKQKRILEKKP